MNGKVGAAAFHPNGEKIAVTLHRTGSGMLQVWDLKTGELETEFVIPLIGDTLQFTGTQTILVDHAFLADTEKKTIVWTYLAKNAVRTERSPDTRYWLSVGSGLSNKKQSITALQLPDAKAVKAIEAAPPKPSLLLELGKAVSIQVNFNKNPPDQPQFAQQMEAKIKGYYALNKIEVRPGEPVTIQLNLTESSTGRQLKFRPFGSSSGSNEVTIPEVNIQCSFVVIHNGDELWRDEFDYSNGSIISFRKKGETIAERLSRGQWSRVSQFFSNLVPPIHIFNIEESRGLGSSFMTSSGVRSFER